MPPFLYHDPSVLFHVANQKKELHFLFQAPFIFQAPRAVLEVENLKEELPFLFHAPPASLMIILFRLM
jgi:hypothetical protein